MNYNKANIVIGGDTCPTRRDFNYFIEGNVNVLFNDLIEIFEASDLSILNLECPLIQKRSPISKSGRVLGAPVACINAIKNLNISLVNLGNNHILDHGQSGLSSTINVCEKNRIDHIGAGLHYDHANKEKMYVINGVRFAILSYAENEFSTAKETQGGANPLGIISFVRKLREIRDRFDHLLVILHAGREHYGFPSPNLQDTCRFMIEEGASVVICQHSHIPVPFEKYKEGYIFYGQGNFLFDPYPDKRNWLYIGFLIFLTFSKRGILSVNIIPHVQSDQKHGLKIGVKSQNENSSNIFIQNLIKNNSLLESSNFIQSSWNEHCIEFSPLYFSMLRGHNKILRKLNQYLKFTNIFYRKSSLLKLQNIIRCETHHEILKTILSDKVSKT